MVRHTLKILQQMLQDFYSVSDQFGTLCIKGLITLLDTLRNCGINSGRSVENML